MLTDSSLYDSFLDCWKDLWSCRQQYHLSCSSLPVYSSIPLIKFWFSDSSRFSTFRFSFFYSLLFISFNLYLFSSNFLFSFSSSASKLFFLCIYLFIIYFFFINYLFFLHLEFIISFNKYFGCPLVFFFVSCIIIQIFLAISFIITFVTFNLHRLFFHAL